MLLYIFSLSIYLMRRSVVPEVARDGGRLYSGRLWRRRARVQSGADALHQPAQPLARRARLLHAGANGHQFRDYRHSEIQRITTDVSGELREIWNF